MKCVGVIKEIITDLFYWFKNNQEQFLLLSHFVNSVQSAGLKLRESLAILEAYPEWILIKVKVIVHLLREIG